MDTLPPSDLEKDAEAALTPLVDKAETAVHPAIAEVRGIGQKVASAVEAPIKLVEQLPSAASFRMGELYTHATAVLGHLAQVAESKLEAEEQAVLNDLKGSLHAVQETARKLFHTGAGKP